MEKYNLILKPIKYGNIELKNRIIFAPTTLGLGKKEYYKKIEAIAKGGTALIIIGDVPVGKSKFTPSLFTKRGFKHYSDLAKICHKYDCKICAQLHVSDTNLHGMFKYMLKYMTKRITDADLRNIMNEKTSDYISNIPTSEVKKITSSFGDAAIKAKAAGFDLVEVHGDRMCGSFSSTIFNKRQDIYGGSMENRFRFAIESVEAIKKAIPTLPIDFKLVVREENPHYGNAGIIESEVKDYVKALEKAGVTSFHVTLANHSKLEDAIPPIDHEYYKGEGCFLKFADLVKAATNLPVSGVGALSNPDFIEAALASGRIDTAAMSRELICDPEWVNKLKNGEEEKIKHCLRCNKGCLGGLYQHKGVHCILDGGNK